MPDFGKLTYINNEMQNQNTIHAIVHGALPDNKTNNYKFLNSVFKEATTDVVYDTSISSNRFLTKTINIPNGIYRIKEPNILRDMVNVRSQNLVINGNGAVFVLEGFEGYLLENNDTLLNIDFHNLNFISLNDDSALKRSLIKSVSNGGAQAIRFHQCNFGGVLKYGIDLQGSNTNSEWIFNGCAFTGKWESFLYIGDTNTSDQFLNYWFNNCKYWCSSNWITAYKGGHFKLNHCDVSGYSPATDTYLFRLLGGAHSWGVTTFIDDGTRYELKTAGAKVIYCEWDNARVSFENSDMGSSSFISLSRDECFHFKNVTEGNGSNYTFKNCVLTGKFKLTSTNVSKRNILYLDQCHLLGDSTTQNIQDIFSYARGSNVGEFIRVNLINTKFKSSMYNQLLDIWKSSVSHVSTKATINQSSYATLLGDWAHKIYQDTFIDEVSIISTNRTDGNSYSFSVRCDISTVKAVLTTRSISVNENQYNFYIGNKITLGDSNTIYTITDMDYRNDTIIILDKDIEPQIISGDKVSFSLVDLTVQNNRHLKVVTTTTKYLVNRDLYIKSIGGPTFPSSGIGAKIIVKTIE